MHLGELQLGLGADALGEGGVADDVAKRLTICKEILVSSTVCSLLGVGLELGCGKTAAENIPFGLELLKGLALGVVADNTGVNEPAQVQSLGAEGSSHGELSGMGRMSRCGGGGSRSESLVLPVQVGSRGWPHWDAFCRPGRILYATNTHYQQCFKYG